MPWEPIKVHAPELEGEQWLNVDRPLSLDQMIEQGPVLLDFWDYTCVNCIRTQPYLLAWHERYASRGLTIVGVHTPEFSFAEQPSLVADAVHRQGIPYPILLDNRARNWAAFSTPAWPTRFLIDSTGIIRYTVTGEGRYRETEEAIQVLLEEQAGADLALPAPLEPLRPTDRPGAVCYRPTPELHLGHPREAPGNPHLGNPGTYLAGRHVPFEPVATRAEPRFYLEGTWYLADEFSEVVAESGRLYLPYRAAEINVVAGSADGEPKRLFVSQDGQDVGMGEAGEDLLVDSELGSYVTVTRPRMHNLVINMAFGRHELMLESPAPGLRIYAFSFVSCTKPTREAGDIIVP